MDKKEIKDSELNEVNGGLNTFSINDEIKFVKGTKVVYKNSIHTILKVKEKDGIKYDLVSSTGAIVPDVKESELKLANNNLFVEEVASK